MIKAKTDYRQLEIDLLKTNLNNLRLEKSNSMSKLYFDNLIDECIKYASDRDISKIKNQYFSNVIYLVNQVDGGFDYFSNIDVSVTDEDCDKYPIHYDKLLEFFNMYGKEVEVIDYEDKYIRLHAEFDNYKKRIEKEKSTLKSQTKYNTISCIIEAIDDIELGIKNDPTNEGLKLVLNKLESNLTKQEVEVINCNIGDDFNVDIHDCLSVIKDDNNSQNKIIEIVNKGYMINSTIVRYPKVIVSK